MGNANASYHLAWDGETAAVLSIMVDADARGHTGRLYSITAYRSGEYGEGERPAGDHQAAGVLIDFFENRGESETRRCLRLPASTTMIELDHLSHDGRGRYTKIPKATFHLHLSQPEDLDGFESQAMALIPTQGNHPDLHELVGDDAMRPMRDQWWNTAWHQRRDCAAGKDSAAFHSVVKAEWRHPTAIEEIAVQSPALVRLSSSAMKESVSSEELEVIESFATKVILYTLVSHVALTFGSRGKPSGTATGIAGAIIPRQTLRLEKEAAQRPAPDVMTFPVLSKKDEDEVLRLLIMRQNQQYDWAPKYDDSRPDGDLSGEMRAALFRLDEDGGRVRARGSAPTRIYEVMPGDDLVLLAPSGKVFLDEHGARAGAMIAWRVEVDRLRLTDPPPPRSYLTAQLKTLSGRSTFEDDEDAGFGERMREWIARLGLRAEDLDRGLRPAFAALGAASGSRSDDEWRNWFAVGPAAAFVERIFDDVPALQFDGLDGPNAMDDGLIAVAMRLAARPSAFAGLRSADAQLMLALRLEDRAARELILRITETCIEVQPDASLATLELARTKLDDLKRGLASVDFVAHLREKNPELHTNLIGGGEALRVKFGELETLALQLKSVLAEFELFRKHLDVAGDDDGSPQTIGRPASEGDLRTELERMLQSLDPTDGARYRALMGDAPTTVMMHMLITSVRARHPEVQTEEARAKLDWEDSIARVVQLDRRFIWDGPLASVPALLMQGDNDDRWPPNQIEAAVDRALTSAPAPVPDDKDVRRRLAASLSHRLHRAMTEVLRAAEQANHPRHLALSRGLQLWPGQAEKTLNQFLSAEAALAQPLAGTAPVAEALRFDAAAMHTASAA